MCILAGGLGTRLGRARARHAQAAARGGRRAVPAAPAAPARRSRAARGRCCASATCGELIECADRRASGSGSSFATATTRPGSTARSGPSAARCRCSASASSSSTATPTCGSTTRDVAARWRESGLPALMTVLRNDGRWDTSNVVYDDGRVRALRQARADARHALDRLRARRADRRRAVGWSTTTSATWPKLYQRLAARGSRCAATRRPSASTRSGRRPRSRRPTPSCGNWRIRPCAS